MERRRTVDSIETRDEGVGMMVAGHASMFDTPYELRGFREQVAKGAFKKSIKEHNPVAFFDHGGIPLGRLSAGTLRLKEDDVGLHYEIDLPDSPHGRSVYTAIERGDVYQSSFAFDVVKESWVYPKEHDSKELPLRTIKEARLYDVSPVSFPASPTTDVDVVRAVRSLADSLGMEPLPADTVADLWSRAQERDATTQEPEAEPGDHSESTHEPERAPKSYHLVGT